MKQGIKKNGLYHLMALSCIAAWSGSYILSVLAMEEQVTPVSLFVSRFLVAYLIMAFFTIKQSWWYGKKDEFLFFITGISGGSLYFILENTALQLTSASNVSLLICFSPMFTLFLLNYKQLKKIRLWGPFLSLTGVAIVIFNNNFVLAFRPVGDLLVLLAAFSWSLYAILLKRINTNISLSVILRKLFFYGGFSALLPWAITQDLSTQLFLMTRPNLLVIIGALSFVSIFCYWLWCVVVRQLGSLIASYYIYLTPVFTFVFSEWILNEIITGMMCAGMMLILWGVYLTEKNQFNLSMKS